MGSKVVLVSENLSGSLIIFIIPRQLFSFSLFFCQVLSVQSSQGKVEVRVMHKQEPLLSRIPGNHRLSTRYLSSSMVADRLKIPPLLLSRIAGSIQVEMGSPDKWVLGELWKLTTLYTVIHKSYFFFFWW